MKNYFFILLTLLSNTLRAQDPIACKTFVTEDHDVIIRFAPVDRATWNEGSKNGYTIERIPAGEPVVKDSSIFRNAIKLSVQLKPFAINDTNWVALIRNNKNAAFVYQALYGESKSKYTNPADKIKAEQSSFGLVLLSADLSPAIARACGFYFKDSTNDPGIYAYRIRVNGKPKLSTIIVVDSRKPTALKEIGSLTGKPGDHCIKLSWNVSENKEDYPGYIVERGDDSIHFTRVNKVPYVQLYSQYEKEKDNAAYSDSIPVNGKFFYYRIRGLSHFGVMGPPSAIIKQKGKEHLDVFPVIDSTQIGPDNKVSIYWKMPAGFEIKKLKGYTVLRSDKNNGIYSAPVKELLPPVSISYTDDKAQFTNYYVVCAVNLDDDTARSYPVLVQLSDKDPPRPPTGLSGTIDSMGRVMLKWSGNPESDLMGYRVFRCNSLNEEFTEVSREILKAPLFRDSVTLNTLTKNIYYAVTAVDHVYNNSGFSEPLLLKRPDKIAPVAPVLTNCIHTDSSITLHWINSTSDDVKRYELYRRSEKEKTAIRIKDWNVQDSLRAFIDKNITAGTIYFYALKVYDDAGNYRLSDERSVIYETGKRDKISEIRFTVDREKRSITLNWTYPEKDVFSFVIYKSKKGEQPRIWKTINGNLHSVVDRQLYIDNIYVYRIKAVLDNGAESEMSDAVEVNY